MCNIINLAQARADRSNLKIQIIRSGNNAGSSCPFLATATDGHEYWCKAINNPQGREVPVNEVAAAIVGDRIQSPIPRWAILDVRLKRISYQKLHAYRRTGVWISSNPYK